MFSAVLVPGFQISNHEVSVNPEFHAFFVFDATQNSKNLKPYPKPKSGNPKPQPPNPKP